MKFAFILAREVAFSIASMCRVLGVSRSGFYAFRAEPLSTREKRDEALLVEVRAAFKASRNTYGSPRIRKELSVSGVIAGKNKIASLMRSDGLVARSKKRFRKTTDSRHDDPIAPNIVERCFTVERKDDTWVTDVTCVWTRSGWLFLAVILDLFSRRVVGWSTSANNDRFLALDALRAAVTRRRPPIGLVHHSDRGSPYASTDYRNELDRFGMIASMSRKGDCWDNAVAESFFSTLKTELVRNHVYESHAHATLRIGNFIDGFYNTTRRHSHLGYLSPIEFELRTHVAAMAA